MRGGRVAQAAPHRPIDAKHVSHPCRYPFPPTSNVLPDADFVSTLLIKLGNTFDKPLFG